MKTMKVIFRKNKDGEIIAFFPEAKVNYGNIMSYMHVGQHCEASYLYYRDKTREAKYEEYKPLFDELSMIYNDCILEVKQRLYYNDLLKSWY